MNHHQHWVHEDHGHYAQNHGHQWLHGEGHATSEGVGHGQQWPTPRTGGGGCTRPFHPADWWWMHQEVVHPHYFGGWITACFPQTFGGWITATRLCFQQLFGGWITARSWACRRS